MSHLGGYSALQTEVDGFAAERPASAVGGDRREVDVDGEVEVEAEVVKCRSSWPIEIAHISGSFLTLQGPSRFVRNVAPSGQSQKHGRRTGLTWCE